VRSKRGDGVKGVMGRVTLCSRDSDNLLLVDRVLDFVSCRPNLSWLVPNLHMSNVLSCQTHCFRGHLWSSGLTATLSIGMRFICQNDSPVFISDRFSDRHNFVKPNDFRALELMDHAARNVMEEYPDIVLGFGESDEFRFVLIRILVASRNLVTF
jgi:tRNAHis guanylyltransferase